MQYFSPCFFKFLDGLAKHNNKEWFEKNRPVYENEVKMPFRKLVEDLTLRLSKDLPELNRDAGKAIFRINRDIRFSKDKSPYKNHVAAVFSRTGTKDQEYPGFYIHFGSEEILVGGGKYFVSKEDLVKIRQEIYYNHDTFKKLLNEKPFKEKYKTLDGEHSKILDPVYKEFLSKEPLIANKQFWFWAKLSRKDVTGKNIDKILYDHFKAGLKMNRFLWDAVLD